MTRLEVKNKIALLEAECSHDQGDPDRARDDLQKAIDELIETECLKEIADERRSLARQFLGILIEKHDDDQTFNRTLAGRSVAYADDLIRTLRERKSP